MSVVSVKELFRKNVYELGKTRHLTREWVVVLSDNVLSSPIQESAIVNGPNSVPDLGDTHPTYNRYKLRKITYTEGHEGSPYHIHVIGEYGVVLARELIHPTSRESAWEFDSEPGDVPAFYYYDGSGNGTTKPLTNSAYDFFPGLVAEESLVSAKVTKNFASLPDNWIAAQGCVNDNVYIGCPKHSVKVRKVSIVQEEEEFEGQIVVFWKATAELHYRQSTHNLQLPDVGFNFLSNGGKYRCMTYDEKNGEWVPSPNPVGLNGDGAQTFDAPEILDRRICPEKDFQSLFGAPPTVPLSV